MSGEAGMDRQSPEDLLVRRPVTAGARVGIQLSEP